MNEAPTPDTPSSVKAVVPSAQTAKSQPIASVWLDPTDLADMDLYDRERRARQDERPPHY